MGAESPKFKGGFRGIALTGWQRWVSAVGGIYFLSREVLTTMLTPCGAVESYHHVHLQVERQTASEHSKWAKTVSNWEGSAFVISDWWKWQTFRCSRP
jgi:hypothetical protein